ncbi:hypothetical protein NX722_27220 [Endozoicomonas gorgoniicola]|uniref:Uncharacterized protein n=2 Tax=Endozoicomonas gorgoniicola TaxID=1234144 RepID=A0ABT3N3S2_9GAMM|nr:hypothetical protein [Endozoicomonas gorgoniicola]MCW7556254.1 hypothetical protein [Endozoicomonas gorgoniicola]
MPLEVRTPGERVIDYRLEHFSEIEWATEKAYKDLFVKCREQQPSRPDRHPFRLYDILTLEPSRRYFRILTLHEVIDLLNNSGYRCYSKIHCIFDRILVRSGGGPKRPFKLHQPEESGSAFDDWVVV